MSVYYLIHGAWQTAATWDLVVPLISAHGHRVETPALPGLGAGNRELTPGVSLAAQVAGIVARLQREPDPVVLAGHSYGGMIISAVAEQVPGKIRRLVFLDAFMPDDGQCALDLLPPTVVSLFQTIAKEKGEGWRLPGGDAQLDLWGLKPGPARDFVRARLCDFTLRCFEGRVSLPKNEKAKMRGLYLACTAAEYPARPFFEPFAAKARRAGWPVIEFDTGHDCHAEQPQEVAAALLQAATV